MNHIASCARGLVAVLLGLLILFLEATPAGAAQAYAVSGTVYEGGTGWFESSTVRHVTTTNDRILLSLQTVPTAGVKWYVVNSTTQRKFGSQIYFDMPVPTGVWKQMASGVPAGTAFQNVFAQDLLCSFRCGTYNFSGHEFY